MQRCSFYANVVYASKSLTKSTSRLLRPLWDSVSAGLVSLVSKTRFGKFVVISKESGDDGWQNI